MLQFHWIRTIKTQINSIIVKIIKYGTLGKKKKELWINNKWLTCVPGTNGSTVLRLLLYRFVPSALDLKPNCVIYIVIVYVENIHGQYYVYDIKIFVWWNKMTVCHNSIFPERKTATCYAIPKCIFFCEWFLFLLSNLCEHTSKVTIL